MRNLDYPCSIRVNPWLPRFLRAFNSLLALVVVHNNYAIDIDKCFGRGYDLECVRRSFSVAGDGARMNRPPRWREAFGIFDPHEGSQAKGRIMVTNLCELCEVVISYSSQHHPLRLLYSRAQNRPNRTVLKVVSAAKERKSGERTIFFGAVLKRRSEEIDRPATAGKV